MKRLTLVAAMIALLGAVASSYAEVQQVRLSGELRLRGYWTDNMTDLNDKGLNAAGSRNDADTYIAQRTRVTVEADLEDHILVVVTLEASSVWGTDNAGSRGFFAGGSGAGHPTATPGSGVHLVEGYVRFQELFWSPLTLTLGRQGLNFGHGLIFSNNEKEYRFDAARFTWDQADHGLTVDLVAAKLAERATFLPLVGGQNVGAGAFNTTRDSDVWFLNGRWEPSDVKYIQNIEAYLGYLTSQNTGGPQDTHIWLFGSRADLNITSVWKLWGEMAFEMGSDGQAGTAENLNGWLLDLGTSYQLENVQWKPTAWIGYTVATGHHAGKVNPTSGTSNRHFVPWFDYDVRGGAVLKPILSNIEILALGVKAAPKEQWTVAATAYMYTQNATDAFGTGTSFAGAYTGHGNPFVDNGGVAASPNGLDSDLGWEFDVNVGYQYSRDVHIGLLFGVFLPGDAYKGDAVSGFGGSSASTGLGEGEKADTAFEGRVEVTVNF